LDKYQKFYVDVESGWNDNIDAVSAEIIFFEDENEKISFKTSAENLIPWERKTLEGFFDTTSFEAKKYSGNLTVSYFGRDVGKSESKMIEVEFVNKTNVFLIVAIIVGILVVAAVIIWFLKKRKKKK